MKTFYILLTTLFATSAIAQTDSTTNTGNSDCETPFQASIFYPLGSNGVQSPKKSNTLSFNLFYGLNGGVNGFELGALVNSNTGNMFGAQIGGIANINAGTVHGFTIAGITNICKDSSGAVAISGISNIAGGSSYGAQISGISNTVAGSFQGAQVSGITNISTDSTRGIQVTGISNISNGRFVGAQIAGISNLNRGDLQGVQIGLVNTASGTVSGSQIGLVNIAKSYKNGVPIGLLNIVKDGYHALEIAGGESIYANLNFKLGVDRFYTIYKAGFSTNGSNQYLSAGLGVGTKVDLSEKFKLSFDFSGSSLFEQTFSPKVNLLSKADISFRYEIGKWLDLFIGPSFNVYVAEHNVDTENTLLRIPYSFYTHNWGNGAGSTSMWIGANAGLSFRF